MKKSSRRLAGGITAGVLVAVVVGAFVIRAGGSERPHLSPASSGSTAAGSGAAAGGTGAAGGAGATGSSPAASATPSPGPEPKEPPLATQTPKVITTQKPVGFGKEVTFKGSKVSAEVVSAESVAGKGIGIGEISGPSVMVTLRLHNDGSRTLDMQGSNVNAYFGDDITPAAPLTGDKRYAPFSGELKPGGSAEGTYVFNVPPNRQGDLRLEVAYAPLSSVAVLVGGV